MRFSPEEQAMFERDQKQMEMQQNQISQGYPQQDMMAMELAERQTSMIKEQLSLSEELETIRNLLDGKVLGKNKQNVIDWIEPPDLKMKILTDHGVHLIMNTILFYLNKNTLLSNYDEETINKKMEDFSTALADVIFMEYELVFKHPTFSECKNVLLERIQRKAELRQFAYGLIGKKVDIEDLRMEFIEEIETKIEKEFEKIKEQLMKNKLKRFEIIIREVQDAVHSTYLRAWNGQERRTLRQHIHVTENLGNNNNMMQKQKKPWRIGMGR